MEDNFDKKKKKKKKKKTCHYCKGRCSFIVGNMMSP